MSHIRQDPTTKDWVIFATDRSRRPDQFHPSPDVQPLPVHDRLCPFCPGNEDQTPPEVYADREPWTPPNTPGWQVRVVPNRFPALRIEERAARYVEDGHFVAMGGLGAHEVIIETPAHNEALADLPPDRIARSLLACRTRFNDLKGDRRFQTIIVFKNHGARAGTSLVHSHAQIIATSVVPREMRRKWAVATSHYDETGRCLYCVLLEDELRSGRRIVYESDNFVAFHPFASRVPFETWIVTRQHQTSFGDLDDGQVRHLAQALKVVLGQIVRAAGNPDYNLVVHTAPIEDEHKEYFQWHLSIIPRLTTPAGFELGSGMSINITLPEETAAFVRDLQ